MKKLLNISVILATLLGTQVIVSSCSTGKKTLRPTSTITSPMGGRTTGNKGKNVKMPMRPNHDGVARFGVIDHSRAYSNNLAPVKAKNETAKMERSYKSKHRRYMGQDKKARRKTKMEFIEPSRSKSLGQVTQ